MGSREVVVRGSAVAAVLLLVLSFTTYFFAVHVDDLFELGDLGGSPGSATIAGAVQVPEVCDWADLFDADPTQAEIDAAVEACGGVDAVFVADQLSQKKEVDDTVFAKGSAKNDAPIADWRWQTGNAPTKDELSNVYTYATLSKENDLVVYAGLERLSGSGDSHIDFEFNQLPISLDKSPPCGDDGSEGAADGPPCEFVGDRTEGDLLIVMDFTKGGDLGIVEIRRWDGTQFVLIDSLGGEGCNAADTVCAVNNGGPIAGGAWDSYDSGGSVTSSIETNAFTEIGVNVTQLFGQSPCFVTLQTKSRSSSSFNSSLKDFVLASFEVCSLEITKGGSPANPDQDRSKLGDPFTFLYTLSNTGAGELECESIVDSLLGDITAIGCPGITAKAGDGATDQSDCTRLAPGVTCEFQITTSVPVDADDPFDTSVTASYSPSSSGTLKAASTDSVITVAAADDFSLNLFQPSVSVTKTGDLIGTEGEAVDYRFDITNTSSADSPPLANAVITDSLLGDLLDPANAFVDQASSTCTDTLDVGATCTIFASRAVQAGDPDPLPNTVDVLYNPFGGYANEIRDSDSHSVDLVFPDAGVTITTTPTALASGEVLSITITIENTGDVALEEISVTNNLLGDVSGSFPDVLGPGESVSATFTYVVQGSDPDPLIVETVATYQVQGLSTQITVSGGATVDVIVLCAKSPGFWQGGEGVPKWDAPTDPVAMTAGFYTGTVFPWLDPSLAGTTYLGILNLPAQGDVTRQLSFKYVAARLNEAAFGLRSDTAQLLDDIDVYFASNPVGSNPSGAALTEGQTLLGALNAYFAEVGEANCPPLDQF